MNETDLRELLQDFLDAECDVNLTESYEDAGICTTNEGLVVRMEDGAEFQITIVQSR